MRSFRTRASGAVALLLIAGLIAACTEQGGGGAVSILAAEPEYKTQSAHYRELQRTGLTGNYTGFAEHLSADETETIVGALNRSFEGRPFDVYTWQVQETQSAMKRLVELRSSAGRLYLYVHLDRVPGGWSVAGWELSRNRATITAQL